MFFAQTIKRLTPYQRCVLLIVLGGLLLSTSGIAVRSLEQTSGLQIVFYRSLGLCLLIGLVLLIRDRNFSAFRASHLGKLGALAGLLFAGASLAIIYALLNTSVANAVFIISLAPFFAAIAAWLVLREKVPMATWIALAIAIAGVLVMVGGGLSGNGVLGIGYAFLMALCYGLFSVCIRAGRGQDMLPAIFYSGVLLVAFAGLSAGSLNIPGRDMLICLTMGVVQLGLASVCLTLGARAVPAAQITLLAMLEVVLNPFWVWLGVGEQPGKYTLAGGALIIGAIAFQAFAQKNDVGPEAAPNGV